MIADAQVRVGLTEQARKTAKSAQGIQATMAWLNIAVALADHGDTKGALAAIDLIKLEEGKYEVVYHVVTTVAHKDLAKARRIADAIKDDSLWRFYAHLEIAKAQAATDRGNAIRAF